MKRPKRKRTKVIPSKEFSRGNGVTLIHGVWIIDAEIQGLEDSHGGKLVRNVFLSDKLNKVSWRYHKEHGKYPLLLRPPEFPGEEFASHQIEITQFGVTVPTKWHAFFRRKKIFVVKPSMVH